MNADRKNIALFLAYFFLSTVLTWGFVVVSPLYISKQQMLLSTAVAGGKWGIQVVLGFLLLSDLRWEFLKRIGFVCFVGSVILVPYWIVAGLGGIGNATFFIGSLAVSVLTMIVLYYFAVRKTGISLKWWLFWLLCLAIAITLQLTVVFGVIEF